jgi:hypothetical protein
MEKKCLVESDMDHEEIYVTLKGKTSKQHSEGNLILYTIGAGNLI